MRMVVDFDIQQLVVLPSVEIYPKTYHIAVDDRYRSTENNNISLDRIVRRRPEKNFYRGVSPTNPTLLGS